ncbi:IclR family transcriptional regulator [Paenibacillus sp.]|uniref:IclR family transcriptional regulator n=1 Tax=Paenibacillus sp. TaxID=58172 RepID=UPI002D2C1706|nr:IclR family transcriptional regulator [Paenibacillus sp.]HZG57983.1 IclR family transcriptional regulator [Paenibacillus sp.]
MDSKYRVPALEKADAVLQAVSEAPYRLRLIDLSVKLGIHKSSLYSLLLTMESLQWVAKDGADTYALGPGLGRLGSMYANSHDLIGAFGREAARVADTLGEALQLGRLEGTEVLYLAKREVPSPIRLASGPGMKFPAHATGLGKALLSGLPPERLRALYAAAELTPLTPQTIASREALFAEVEEAARNGFAEDREESVIGFCCVAAPIKNGEGETVAAVSCSMPSHVWERKRERAREEMVKLAARLTVF